MTESPVLGIDLGTTTCCVGVFHKSRIEIIPNSYGNRTTPSCVAYTENGQLVGEAAVSQTHSNPENTLYTMKRLLGCQLDEPLVVRGTYNTLFIGPGEDKQPKIQIIHKGSDKKVYPEEIVATLLRHIRKIAEQYIGKTVNDAVITVPANFSNSQRLSMRDACKLAGLNSVRMISDAVAAAVTHSLGMPKTGIRKILVYDMGGGKLDVSVVATDGNRFDVLATAGDTQLGGEDFTHRLIEYFAQDLKKKYDKEFSDDPVLMSRLRTLCETAKHTLSISTQANVNIQSVQDGIDYRTVITRTQFEVITADLFQKALNCVERTLLRGKLDKSSIDEIVMIGGATRVKNLQKTLIDFFDGKDLNKYLHLEESLAYGAAVIGASLSGVNCLNGSPLHFSDVLPLSLGLEIDGGIITPLISEFTPFPVSKTYPFTTMVDNQARIVIQVYEGEHIMATQNNLLATFEISGIPPEPRGIPKIHIRFNVDIDGILGVSFERQTNEQNEVELTNRTEGLSSDELGRLQTEFETVNNVTAGESSDHDPGILRLEQFLQSLDQIVHDDKITDGMPSDDRNQIEEKIAMIRKRLRKDDEDADEDDDAERGGKTDPSEQMLAEIEALAVPILTRLFQRSALAYPNARGQESKVPRIQ